MPWNSLEHCIGTTTMTNILPDRDSSLVPPGYKPKSIRMSHQGRPVVGGIHVEDIFELVSLVLSLIISWTLIRILAHEEDQYTDFVSIAFKQTKAGPRSSGTPFLVLIIIIVVVVVIMSPHTMGRHCFYFYRRARCAHNVLTSQYVKNYLSDCLQITHTTHLGCPDMHFGITVLWHTIGSIPIL